MSQGTDLANNAASTDPSEGEPEQVWFVAVTGDDVKQMTLDQVAESFEAGLITSQTAVWTEGMEEWAPLEDVADLGEDSEDESAPAVAAEPTALPPVEPVIAAPMAVAPMAAVQQTAAMPAAVAPQAAAMQSPVASASMNPGAAPFVGSTMPVALNVDDDEPLAPKKARPIGKWVLAVAGVAALAITAANTDMFGGSKKQAQVTVKATKSLAARPFEAREKAGSENDSKDKAVEEAVAKKIVDKAELTGDAPIGTATAKEAAEGSTSKKSLRDGFSGSSKKAKKKKKAKKRKSKRRTKARSKSSRRRKSSRKRPSRKKKKAVKRTQSAFDPLNGSLP